VTASCLLNRKKTRMTDMMPGDDEGDDKRIMMMVLWALLLTAVVVILTGCSPRVVQPAQPVIPADSHTGYENKTDTVIRVDSIIDRQTLVIREVDSLTMARYGIQLKDMEKAWLVESDKLYREIERLREARSDTVTAHDTIHVPYPVEVTKEVSAELTGWQRLKMKMGVLLLLELLVAVVLVILRIRR